MVNTKDPGASQPPQTVKPKPSFLKGSGLPSVIIVIIAVLATLNFTGVINFSGFLNPASDNYFNWEGVFNPDNSNPDFKVFSPKECPETSCDTGTCCHSSEYDPLIETNVAVYAVLTYDKCECPSGTTYEGDRDTITPGGPYKICICNEIEKNT
ncbi:MAG: hypothetical protein ABIB43_00150 [archaeon]